MPTNQTLFYAANYNASRPEVVKQISIVGDQVTEGYALDFEVPKGLTAVMRIVFDFTEYPQLETTFTLKDSVGVEIGSVTVDQRSVTQVLSIDNLPMTPGNPPIPRLAGGAVIQLSWPAFLLASSSSNPIGAPLRTMMFMQFYEDSAVIGAEQTVINNARAAGGGSRRGVKAQTT